MSTAHSPPTNPRWAEIGRATPGGGAPWIVCIAPVGESGALYRTQIVVESLLTITVDLIAHRGAPVRRVHRASCKVPPDGDVLGEAAQRLVEAADEAASIVLTGSSCNGPRLDRGVGAIDDEAMKQLPTTHRQVPKTANKSNQPIDGP
jgi:hypothetical protein